jgi:hypothetical protein
MKEYHYYLIGAAFALAGLIYVGYQFWELLA